MTCLNKDSPKTKGLYFTISLIVVGRVSSGRTVEEKNNKIAAMDIEAIFEVSEFLKIYPMNIPSRINTEAIKIIAPKTFNSSV